MNRLEIRSDPPRAFLCVSGLIWRDRIAGPIAAMIERFAARSAGLVDLGVQIALYHPQGRDPFGPDGEPCWIGRELATVTDAPGGLQLNWTPGGTIAVLIHEGPHERMLDTHFTLHRAAQDAGHRLVGPNWERYLSDHEGSPLRTEVCYLLAC
ncbi:hypothetical protein NS277_08665 [Novosphingobium barchaimii]|nr:hypothetical protein NS277_08665 [Novosphingobium barchaimii]